jgi:hypothetical protein
MARKNNLDLENARPNDIYTEEHLKALIHILSDDIKVAMSTRRLENA